MIDIRFIGSGSSGNSCRITDGKTPLLLDAGLSYREISRGCGYSLSEVQAVLITHRHRDHCKALPELASRGYQIYAPVDVYYSFDGLSAVNLNTAYPYNMTTIGTWTVTPFAVPHDVPCVGYYLHSMFSGENLLYVTDAMYVREKFDNLNYILIEANYSPEILRQNGADGTIGRSRQKRTYSTHMSVETTLDMLRANDLSKLKQVWLMHLSDDNSNAAEFKRRVQEVCGCEVYVA